MICKVKMGNIFYEVCGEGFPIIILHSMGTDHRSMKAWLEPIFKNKSGYQRVYIDLPAHGRSEIDENLKSTDDILSNILEFIDKLIPKMSFSLIGHSYGGYLAQGILHFRSIQVKSICLLTSALHKKERTLPKRVVLQRDDKLLNSLDTEVKTAFETLMIYQNKENLEHFLKPGRLLANREFLTSNWREKGYFLTEEPFHDRVVLSQPALVMLGKQDSICGYEDYDFLLDKFSRTTFVILDSAGHMVQIDKRVLVQELIKDWLSKEI